MMYYQELTIHPDPETPRTVLREKVFAGLHLAFIEAEKQLTQAADISTVRYGLSFPHYNADLFEVDYTFRVFAAQPGELETLQLAEKLARLRDYLKMGSILPCPAVTRYACYRREQKKSSLARIARRQVKRGKFPTYEHALQELRDREPQRSKAPFIYITTSSTGIHRVPLFIEQRPAEGEQRGQYTTYGLSKAGSTVPVF